MGVLGNLLGKMVGGDTGAGIISFFNKRQELKQELSLAKLEGEIAAQRAKNEYRVKDLEYDAQWELEQIKNSGWKDEFTLLLLSLPLVLVFIPPTQQLVLDGFAVLEQCPDWYKGLIVMILAATYGIRIWRRQDAK